MEMVSHSICRKWRLAAYRQFTWWVHGVLGKKNRRVISACVVNAIRREFPEESGYYEGFKAPELDLNYVPVNSKTAHPLPGQTPGHFTFLKKFGEIPRYVAVLTVKCLTR